MKCKKKHFTDLTRRISSHDFFAGTELMADVMVESSVSDAGLTADAMQCVSNELHTISFKA